MIRVFQGAILVTTDLQFQKKTKAEKFLSKTAEK
jgi:hypothetical protein